MISPNQDTNLRLNFGKLNFKRISTIVKRAYLKKRFLSFARCLCLQLRGRHDIYLHTTSSLVHVSMATAFQLNYCTSTNGRGGVFNIVLVLHDLIFNCR